MVSQWRSSVNLHNWNTLEGHWKTTGSTLATKIISPVAFQCTLGSKFQAHWIATGLPLEDHWLRVRVEPQVHWNATGTTLADASTQWCPSGDPVLICIIGTHWKTIGKPLEDHWKTTGSTLTTKIISPVAFQCTLGSKFQAHWIATGRPLAQGKGCDYLSMLGLKLIHLSNRGPM